MNHMFAYCENLKNIDLSSFDTSNAQYMISMFYDCKNIEILDLTSFNFKKVYNISNIFNFCSNLKEIKLSHNDFSNVIQVNLFEGCNCLKINYYNNLFLLNNQFK